MSQQISPSTEECRRNNPQMEDVYAEPSPDCNSTCWGWKHLFHGSWCLPPAPQAKSFCRGLALTVGGLNAIGYLTFAYAKMILTSSL